VRLKPFLKFCVLIASAVLLSMTTFVFGAIPMRAVRLAFGRLPFWAGFALASAALALAGLPAYALLVFSLVIVVGVYTDVEEHGGSVFISGFTSVLTALGTTALCGGLWLHRAKLHLLDEVRALLAQFEAATVSANPAFTINADTFIQQLPSAAVIALVIGLGIALIGEARLLRWIGYPRVESPAAEQRLSMFRIPDAFVWIAIAAVFGAFVKHGNSQVELISMNVLNVLVVMFFFQGIAIVSQAFRSFKVSPFWQGLWYILLVFQLFFLVSLVGFADFWLEFRERLARKPAASNKSF
jgi:hypothetical protein